MKDYKQIINNSKYKQNIAFDPENKNPGFELININNHSILDAVEFIRVKISKDTRIKITSDIIYSNWDFKVEVDLSNCDFFGRLIFIECIFVKDVSFKGAIFNNETSFADSEFNSKVRFHWAKFKISANFNNTVFQDLIDFYCVVFEKTQKFYLTDFLGIAIFSNVTFEKQVQFLYNKVNNNTIISFESSKFKQALDLSRANFWCKLNFWASTINPNPTELWLYETDEIKENKLSSTSMALKRLRESFRIIKYQFRKEGNNIEAIRFQKIEMELLYQELSPKKKNKRRTRLHLWLNNLYKKIDINKKETRFSLWLNKLSNNFGTSWSNGLIFTILSSIVFYCIFLIALLITGKIESEYTNDAFWKTLKHWIEFLNITKWNSEYFKLEDLGFLGYLVLFISRIFIGYGYYQTVQAFRKYGKN